MSTWPHARKTAVRLGPGCLLLAGALATAWLGLSLFSPICAAEPLGGPTLSAADLVQEALGAESDGRSGDFARWSHEALARSPDLPAAHWLAGQVTLGGGWVKAEEASKLLATDKNYQEYLRLRAKYADKVVDQFRLGQWCSDRKLTEQARAHFTRVVQLEPNNTAARARLGYKRVGKAWCTATDIQRQNRLKSEYAQWMPKVKKIRSALAASDSQRREKARADLASLAVPAAVSAIENVLTEEGEPTALLAVETLGKIDGPEATHALARLAIFSPYHAARQAAIRPLKSRPWGEFVPAMLAAMAPRIDAVTNVTYNTDGTAALKQQLTREKRDVIEQSSVDATFRPGAVGVLDRRATERANSLTRVYETVLNRQKDAKEYNDRASKVNAPIAEALNDITDQQLESDAKTWWDWWDNYNEMRYGDKPVVQTNQTYTFVDYMLPYGQPNGPSFGPMYGAHSCFAAGTPVWTVDGPRPVEGIAVGDLVLAQDPATGELAYKAVLRTTVAPPADLVTVIAGEDRLVCTSGHCFWVPGRGWVHASKLDAPMPLHKVAGAATVSQVGRGPKEAAYNLVVADFNTYFVGKEKLLVHDVTLPAPTAAELPGQKTP
ncbi:MAG: polymorphic toxin-type HINT domain-containing protein [Thermoguttaceae bacterium]